jgi:hypothetical protein
MTKICQPGCHMIRLAGEPVFLWLNILSKKTSHTWRRNLKQQTDNNSTWSNAELATDSCFAQVGKIAKRRCCIEGPNVTCSRQLKGSSNFKQQLIILW